MHHDYLLAGESEERIRYLAKIGAIFERLYGIKDLHDAEFRATTNAGGTAKMLSELGYNNERIEYLFVRAPIGCLALIMRLQKIASLL
ncbi:hypothetical protein [Paenibacillus ehimensis]|uniref:Uncharacterized protein n=1 Tax=Paenibacillus ehimensis TaxID=79264 RepID=A0ABT8V7F1_9BACL|nr:hypothetical protein [Paenibacillus ehimensis]MDO3677379.1 hypothetical protein [Paenibacillus ehimensis]MEC0207991.1 hypothetical protein [Paenibacillus ehimensis]